jgi:hypothetical protein
MTVAFAGSGCRVHSRNLAVAPVRGTKVGATQRSPATGRAGGVWGRKSIARLTHIVGRHIDLDQCRRLRRTWGHGIKSAREPTVFAATVRRDVTVPRPINPATLSQPRDQAFALWQGIRRGISVGRHVVRRWNPCPDPDCQIADSKQRCRGLKPRTGRNRLAAERTSNPLFRVRNRLLGMRRCCQQNCEDAEDSRAYRIHG